MKNATMNICVKVFVWTFIVIFLGVYLGVGLLGHMINLRRNCQTGFQKAGSLAMYKNSNFQPSATLTCLFDCSRSGRCELVSHCGFAGFLTA